MVGIQPVFHDDAPAGTTEVHLRDADATTRTTLASGSSLELFAGVLALALAIVGLTGYLPLYMASAAMVAVGFSLLAQGSTIAARWQQAIRIVGRERADAASIGTEMFGGLAAIVLGVLALADVQPLLLLPIAALVLGIALLLGGPAQLDFAELATTSEQRWRVTRTAVRASSGVMVMGGLAAFVLGVLAIAKLAPVVTVSLIAVLCVSAALMLAGGALLARFTRDFS